MRASRHQPNFPSVRAEIQPGIWLDSRLALWLEAGRLLVMADLHWGYAASHRARGNLLPWWGDDEIERRIESLLEDYRPEEMLWLGDVVHAAEGAASAEAFLRRASVPITHIAGNHDRRWPVAGEKTARRGSYFLHHGDSHPAVPPDCLEIVGHHHPAASWGDGAGGSLKLPALVVSATRFVLPAFSPWAAGTAWCSAPDVEETLWAVSPARIFRLPRRNRPAFAASA